MTPKISVLLPVYNGERYVRTAIDSVLRQTFPDFELLIVDDGSTDDTPKIIRSYGDQRVRLVQNPARLKLSGALNRGLDIARGVYVARMDADDICNPDRLALQHAFLERHSHLGMCGSWIRIFGLRRPKIYKPPIGFERIRAKALFDNPFVHPTVMIRREFFERHGLRFNGWYYPTEDFELWTRAIRLFPCDNLDKVLLHYRQHEESMTGSDWSRMDAKSLHIVNDELTRFGIEATKEELALHRRIGREMSYKCKSRSEISRSERWLHRLIVFNETHQAYQKEALMEIVRDAWFRLCLNSSNLGLWVLRKYLYSPLAGGNKDTGAKRALVILSMMKSILRHTINRLSSECSD